jgi:hypothetical protein
MTGPGREKNSSIKGVCSRAGAEPEMIGCPLSLTINSLGSPAKDVGSGPTGSTAGGRPSSVAVGMGLGIPSTGESVGAGF